MLPSGWSEKESKSRPGVKYYANNHTGETQWFFPTEPATPNDKNVDQQVQASHILKKHKGSRRPSSWRVEVITQSEEDAVAQITEIRTTLVECLQSQGQDAIVQLFADIASVESDCSSAQKGGDLGMFGRGAMQKPFEAATFSLQPGGLSEVVKTDSGIHVILRTG